MILETQKSVKELLKGGVKSKEFEFSGTKDIYTVSFGEDERGMFYKVKNSKKFELISSKFFSSKKEMLFDDLFPFILKLGFKDNEKSNDGKVIKVIGKNLSGKFDMPEFSGINLSTVADIKRLPIGTFLRRKFTPKQDKLGTFVKIQSVKSNGFDLLYDETRNVTSKLDFPTTKDCIVKGNQFIYLREDTKKIELIYEVFKDEGLSLLEMEEKYKDLPTIGNLKKSEIKNIDNTDQLVITFLNDGKIIFYDSSKGDGNFHYLISNHQDNFLEANISKYFPGKSEDTRFKNSRLLTKIYYTKNHGFGIVLTDSNYKTFNSETDIIFNEELGFNLIKGDGKYYEIQEDSSKIPSGRNYGPDMFIEYKGKVTEKTGKTPEDLKNEVNQKNIKNDIERKAEESYSSETTKIYRYITAENIEKYLLSKGFSKYKPGEENRSKFFEETYYTNDLEKKDIFINGNSREKSFVIGIKKLKHIDIPQEKINKQVELFKKIESDLDLLEAAGENSDPIKNLEKQLQRELSNGRKKAKITFKDGSKEERTLFIGTNGFGYLPKGAKSKGYVLKLDNIESIIF